MQFLQALFVSKRYMRVLVFTLMLRMLERLQPLQLMYTAAAAFHPLVQLESSRVCNH